MMLERVSLSHCGVMLVAGVNLWLLAVTASELRSNSKVIVDKMDWKPNSISSVDRVEIKRTMDSYKEILARPIFYKSREPFVPPARPVAVAKPPPANVVDPGFIVAGVIIAGKTKQAYIYTKVNNSGTWTKEGDNFLGWKVSSIDSDGVRLQQAGRTIEVWLYPEINNAQH
ncbi:MAG TPA: hypothetical protein VFP60_02835 [Pseudolabrys sp.]|nr:hypothetical protein [Pseudolabrys sp.]